LFYVILTLSQSQQDTAICEEVVTKAYNSWSKTTALERSKVLKKLAALMVENQEDLAKIVTLEAGKPLTEARGEIQVRCERQ
jgi:succinate-semialdehyde dehydrogenase/glutarate-semialdehyde dehydrogenase